MIDYLQQLSSATTAIDSTPDFLFSSNQSQLIQPNSTPLPPFQQGVFEVGAEGAVEIDFLFDGGEDEGEIGIFSLDSMPTTLPEFTTEAVRRALSNTPEGYIVISDVTEGARMQELQALLSTTRITVKENTKEYITSQ